VGSPIFRKYLPISIQLVILVSGETHHNVFSLTTTELLHVVLVGKTIDAEQRVGNWRTVLWDKQSTKTLKSPDPDAEKQEEKQGESSALPSRGHHHHHM